MVLLKKFLSLFRGKSKRLTVKELENFIKTADFPYSKSDINVYVLRKKDSCYNEAISIGGIELISDDEETILWLVERE